MPTASDFARKKVRHHIRSRATSEKSVSIHRFWPERNRDRYPLIARNKLHANTLGHACAAEIAQARSGPCRVGSPTTMVCSALEPSSCNIASVTKTGFEQHTEASEQRYMILSCTRGVPQRQVALLGIARHRRVPRPTHQGRASCASSCSRTAGQGA